MSKIRNFKLKNKNKKQSRAEWGAGALVFCRPCKDARSGRPSILLQLRFRLHSHPEPEMPKTRFAKPFALGFHNARSSALQIPLSPKILSVF